MAFFDASKSELFIGATDYKTYATDVDGIPGGRAVVPVTTIGDTGAKHIPSLQSAQPNIGVLFEDTVLDAILAALRTASSGTVLTFWSGGDALSDRGWGIGSVFATGVSNQSAVGQAVKATLNLESNEVAEAIISLGPKITGTTNASGTSIDDGAGSSNGWSFFLHVFAITATGGNAEVDVRFQHSTDDSVWVTLDTTAVANGVPVSIRAVGTGTFNRYVRWQIVRDSTSHSITFQCSYKRG